MNNYPFEPGNPTSYGPYQPNNPSVPPPPPQYQPGNSQPPYPSGNAALPYPPPSDPYAPTRPVTPYMPPFQPPIQPPIKPRGGPNKILLIVVLIVVVVVVIGSFVGISIARSGSGAAVSTPIPTQIPYPVLTSAYSGLAHNITYNQDAEMAMTSVVQDANKINGNMQFGLPLVGNSAFTGTVTRDATVQFVISGSLTSTFKGTIDKQGTMSGTYSISNGQKGTWKVAPSQSPVIYPLLFASYTGTFKNDSTGKTGAMTLTSVTQNQATFTGMLDASIAVNGTVGSDNSIKFAGTYTNGQPINFTGTVNTDSSLSGSYSTSGVTGTWKVAPGTS